MPEATLDRAATVPLTGWGRTAPTPALLTPVHDDDAVRTALAESTGRGVLARGLARSYGDAAQNAGGHVLDMTTYRGVLAADLTTGLVDVEAGISLDELMTRFVPQGFFVPVTAGTRYVTVGGAIAADIHGKNHHVAGSFSQHVRWLDLLTADGQVHRVSPDSDADLFWATAGGMGLTGVILRAQVQMKPIESSRIVVDTDRTPDLDALMTLLTETDHLYEYSVAWIDCVTKGRRMGRSVLTRGRFARRDELPAKRQADPLAYSSSVKLSVPNVFPPGMLNLATVSAFNELWYRKAPTRKRDQLQSIPAFFHPLDGVGAWNRIYGPRGFVQYQFTVPFGQEEAMREAMVRIASSGTASFLAVLKRFGPGNPGMLSYPSPGWTLALDIPVVRGLATLLDQLDELVLAAGGRIYLAKDSRVRAETFAQMYERIDDFRAVRARVDPDGVFTSDLARRLEL
ncbi:FAD-binding protein [Modestobacter sp. I12A-02628]|uniref:FAD-binding oxidoreductase n=1 Tax=Goekera deserti TaxID=2497753 RepID=A0A7K3W9E0_9ACTN|nr:FAD-binding oxidoreductase [Goekera deserti]MPR00333.1 FAD-binding protein [Goekera deserti]NDI49507.1 FAD-binding protein [Goekera deserti]NEL52619.1 FAD-binding oxidoreductase [Goekera deserti]